MSDGQVFIADRVKHQFYADLRHFFHRRGKGGQPSGQKIRSPSIVVADDRDVFRDPQPGFRNGTHSADRDIVISCQICSGDFCGKRGYTLSCFGHTRGECAAIDDKSRILFIGDACNCNYLLGEDIADNFEESADVAIKGLERIWDKGDAYDRIYNSHHDYRGLGCPLAENVLPDLIECLRRIKMGICDYRVVPDMLSYHKTKKVAVYKKVQVTYLGGGYQK